MPSKTVKRLNLVLLSLFLISSCIFPPFQQTSPPALKHSAVTQTLGFKIQSLIASEPPPPVLPTVTQLPTGEPEFELQFQTQQKSKHMIEIPEYGQFKVNFEAGNGFKILDRDATDGEAHVQVPTAVFDLYLRLKPPFNQKSKFAAKDPAHLQIQDLLYGLNQTVAPQAGELWHHLSRRPFPIPTSWGNATGSTYQLSFENKGNKGFMTQWFKQTGQPDLPQSVKIVPRIDCIQPNLNGTHTAFLGYDNHMPTRVEIPIGPFNQLLPGEADQGQPLQFEAGSSPVYPQTIHAAVFKESLTWTINQRSVTVMADNEGLRCEKRTEIPIAKDVTIRETFIPQQTFRIDAGNQAIFKFSFQVNHPVDLKRRVVLSLFNGDPRVNQAVVSINGQKINPELDDQNLLTQGMPGISIESFGSLRPGENQISIALEGQTGSQIKLSLDGFMLPEDIPEAHNSRVPRAEWERAGKHVKGRIGIKFLEGMQVRLNNDPDVSKRLHDLTQINLYPLTYFLKSLGVTHIYESFYTSVEENDAYEESEQARLGVEVPNHNLYYHLYFDEEGKDIWRAIEILRGFPFIEEAWVETVFDSAQATSTPSPPPPPYIPNDPMIVVPTPLPSNEADLREQNRWLRVTGIANRKLGYPLSAPEFGAWDITRGDPSVKIAILEKTPLLTHEDLQNPNIRFIDNIQANSETPTDFDHATSTLGIIAAQNDNGIGVSGIAPNASILYIRQQDEFGSPSACKGNSERGPDGKCNHVIDALELALQEKVDIVYIGVWDSRYGTLEVGYPEIRGQIKLLVQAGITVVMAAGNSSCANVENIPHFPYKDMCLEQHPHGFDVRYSRINKKITYYYYDLEKAGDSSSKILHALQNPIKSKTPLYTIEGPMPDTGSIVVGGLKIDGSEKLNPGFPYGRTETAPNDHNKIIGGHGIDISGPAQGVWTTTSETGDSSVINKYDFFSGSSAAAPAVTGIIALMMSSNPDLKDKPAEVRTALRLSAQSELLKNQPPDEWWHSMPGMVDASKLIDNTLTNIPPTCPKVTALRPVFLPSGTITSLDTILPGAKNNYLVVELDREFPINDPTPLLRLRKAGTTGPLIAPVSVGRVLPSPDSKSVTFVDVVWPSSPSIQWGEEYEVLLTGSFCENPSTDVTLGVPNASLLSDENMRRWNTNNASAVVTTVDPANYWEEAAIQAGEKWIWCSDKVSPQEYIPHVRNWSPIFDYKGTAGTPGSGGSYDCHVEGDISIPTGVTLSKVQLQMAGNIRLRLEQVNNTIVNRVYADNLNPGAGDFIRNVRIFTLPNSAFQVGGINRMRFRMEPGLSTDELPGGFKFRVDVFWD